MAEEHFVVGGEPEVMTYEGDDSTFGMGEESFNEDSYYNEEDTVMIDGPSFLAQSLYEDSQSSSDLPVGDEAEWKEDDSVPPDWKVKEFLTKAGQKLEHIQSPTGVFFPGRKAAVEWMREQGQYTQEDIELMQSKLKIRWTDDDPTIPVGWKSRQSQVKTKTGMTDMQWFLSPEGKMFRGRKAVLKFIQANPEKFDPDDIRKFKSVPTGNKKFSADYDWNDQDPTVPEGWKSAIITMNSFGKMVESVRFLSPDGRFCTSRVEAIKYLLKDGGANHDDLMRMQMGLLQDGWETDENLPLGWFMKPDRCRGKRKEAHYNYLSSDFEYHRSTKAAIAHMKTDPNFTQDDIDKLIRKTNEEGKKLRPDKYDWMDGDESVPEGWKIRIVHCTNGLEREFFLAPDGSSYSGRKQALEYMRKVGYDEDDIRRMSSGCRVKWVDDDPTLPDGWKTRTSEINSKNGKIPMQWFLNPEGKMLRGRKAALIEIESGKYSKEDIRKFKFVIPEEKKKNYEWNENDPSVPMGWLTTMITMNSFGKMVRSKRFMAPCGRFCSSRDDAIKYMLKEGIYDDEEIEAMQAGFGDDQMEDEGAGTYGGWEVDEEGNPMSVAITGTKRKMEDDEDYEDEDGNKIPKLEVVDFPADTGSNYNSEDDEYEGASSSVRIRGRVRQDNAADEDCFQLRSWRTGKRISRNAGDIDEDYSPSPRSSRPSKSREEKDEGWVDDDPTVPPGWKTKTYVNKGGQQVKNMMSPCGTFCAGRKSAIEFMENSDADYGEDDINIMKEELRGILWTEDDPTAPMGWKSRVTQIRTKTGVTEMQWFLSPEGKMFRGRKSALKFMESMKYYSKEDIRNFKSKPTSEKKFSKDYDWNEDDPTIPPGWKSTTIQMNSFGKIVESNRYMAPDGRYCSNRLDALRYMTKEGIFTQEDIHTMKEGLTEDGWKADPGLPTGWYMKPRKDKVNEATASYHYVSDTFQNFESTKSAIKYMIESCKYSKKDVKKLEAKIVQEAKKLCPDKYDWIENGENVPPGWKYRVVKCTNNLERHFFLAPDGSSYSGRKQAVDYMRKHGHDENHIKIMEAGFKIQWLDDDPSLPQGWKTRFTDMKTKNGVVPMQWFLSPEGKMFRGRKSALDHITKSGLYDKEDIRKFKHSGDTPTKSNYDWDDTDTSVPQGWKTTMILVNSFGKQVPSKRFLSPDGRFCSSRIDSLKYMVKEDIFLPQDIEKMKMGLLEEDWELDDLLPPAWFVKPDKHKEEEATFNYLTPDFTFLRSTRAALNFMKNKAATFGYTSQDIDRLNEFVDIGRKKIRMEKYGGGSAKADTTVPDGWRLKASATAPGAAPKVQIIAPDGSSFMCRRSALQHMVKEMYSEEEKEEMRGCLKHEGWEEDNLLPNGWRMRKAENTTNGMLDVDYTVMSREGEVFNSLKTAVEFMEGEASGCTEEDVAKIRSLYDNESKQNRAQKYDWVDSDTTVPSNWRTRVVEGKMRKKFFLAPDGSSFSCRRSGLQHMIKEGFPASEIEDMREKLVHEGWESNPALPKDWKIRKSEGTTNGIYDVDYWFLSVEGLLFRSTKSVCDFMKESGSYSQEDVAKISKELESERTKIRQQKYDWLDGNPTVPPGWKVRVVEGKTTKTFFLSEDGNQFACRRSALQHMIKEGAESEQVELMRSCLIHEGWEDDSHLPPAWKVRKSEGSTNGQFDVNYYYLSSDGTMFHSTRAVINYMKKRPQEYNEGDIKQIKTRLENETRKNRPQKYDWKEEENLPEGWKYRTIIKGGIRTDFILTAEGGQHQSRRAAIENMIKENYDPHAIFKMWSTLDVEGWVTDDDRLPKGWRVRSKDRLKDNWQFYFLSPQMEIFKSNKSVLDYIASQSDTYSSEDFEKVKLWIEEEQRERRGNNYTWNDDPSLPVGWKMRTVITNSNNIREFFLHPNGDHISGRKKAIEVMREEGGYEKKEFDKMIRKMKQVSDRNQNKPSQHQTSDGGWGPGGNSKDRDTEDDEWRGGSIDPGEVVEDEYESGALPSYDPSAMHDGSEEPNTNSFYSDEDSTEMEDMQMFDDGGQGQDTIHLGGFVPEFEPVEITPVNYNENREEEDDDEDGFNDVEEITDDMCEVSHDVSGAEDHFIQEGDIKVEIEPDINQMMSQYME